MWLHLLAYSQHVAAIPGPEMHYIRQLFSLLNGVRDVLGNRHVWICNFAVWVCNWQTG